MSGPMLKLNGRDEGIIVSLETKLSGADLPEKVFTSITNLFPNFTIDNNLSNPELGNAKDQLIHSSNLSIDIFLQQLHKQKILDTALDSMSLNLDSNECYFHISRQAALSGKISFNIPGEFPLGGTMKITLQGNGDCPSGKIAARWPLTGKHRGSLGIHMLFLIKRTEKRSDLSVE